MLPERLLFNNDNFTYEVNPSDSTFTTTEKPFTSAEPYTRNQVIVFFISVFITNELLLLPVYLLDEEINKWKEWNYNDGMILPQNLIYPYRQMRAGMPYGVNYIEPCIFY